MGKNAKMTASSLLLLHALPALPQSLLPSGLCSPGSPPVKASMATPINSNPSLSPYPTLALNI